MKLSNYKVPCTKNIKLKKYKTSEGKKKDNQEIKENIVPPLVEKLKDLHLKLNAQEENGIMVEDISFFLFFLPDSVNSCFYSPITSLISYMPGSLSARNSAADNAPLAKTALE